MRVLVDTNVVMDALEGQAPFFDASNQVLKICALKQVEGYLAAHSITNLFYLFRKRYSNDECRDILLSIFDIFQIEQIDTRKLKTALVWMDLCCVFSLHSLSVHSRIWTRKDKRRLGFWALKITSRMVSPARMSDAELDAFKSDLKEVLKFIKHSTDKKELKKLLDGNEKYQKLDRLAAQTISACSGVDFNIPVGKE